VPSPRGVVDSREKRAAVACVSRCGLHITSSRMHMHRHTGDKREAESCMQGSCISVGWVPHSDMRNLAEQHVHFINNVVHLVKLHRWNR
jgi:hypothetical protein